MSDSWGKAKGDKRMGNGNPNTRGEWDSQTSTSGTPSNTNRQNTRDRDFIVSELDFSTSQGETGPRDPTYTEVDGVRFAVEGAYVLCTGAESSIGTPRMVEASGAETVNGATILVHTDVYFRPYFTRCIITGRRCDPEIEDNEWKDYDDATSNGKHKLSIDKVYMKCNTGSGLLILSTDGQIPFCADAQEWIDMMLGKCIFALLSVDPVNLSTGNFIYDCVDMRIEGEVSLEFKRFYNGKSRHKGVLGRGWIHNYEIQLYQDRNQGGIRVLFADGHQEHFWLEEESGKYLSSTDTGNVITRPENLGYHQSKDRGYLLKFPNKATYHFDNKGKLNLKRDPQGREITFSYDGEMLMKVSSTSGELNFIYEDEERLIAVRDHTGREIHFEHHYLAFNTYMLGVYTDTKGNSYQYFYDQGLRLCRLVNPEGYRSLDNIYDLESRVVKQWFSDGGVMEYDYNKNISTTKLTERDGSESSYQWDRKYRTTEASYPMGRETFRYNELNQRTLTTDRKGGETSYHYSEEGKLASVVDPLRIATEFDYTKDSKIAAISVDGKIKVRNQYDKDGNLSVVEDALGQKVKFTYLKKGRVESTQLPDGSAVHLTYDDRGNVIKVIDSRGVKTRYEYDGLNRVSKTTDGNGTETHYQYDTEGNITKVKNALGDVCTYTYNKRNMVTSITDFSGASIQWEYEYLKYPTKIIDEEGRILRMTYNLMWNLAELIEHNGAITRFDYNDQNLLESVQKPDETVIKYEYDANGNKTAVTDEEGYQTWFTYDVLNRLTEVNGEEGLVIRYTYNGDGQVTSVADALGNTVILTYNEIGKLIEERNPLGECRYYTYTPLGNLETIVDEAGRKTSYTYLPGGQLLQVYFPNNTTESYTYDDNGNIHTITDVLGICKTHSYDSLNRVTKITESWLEDGRQNQREKFFTYNPIGRVTSMTDEAGNTTCYEHTRTGKLAKVIDPLGNVAAYTYDHRDQLIEIRQFESTLQESSLQERGATLGMDEDLQQVIAANQKGANLHITRYERNLTGQVEKVIDALGQTEEYKYDKKGQLVEKIDKEGYLTKYGYTSHGDVNFIQYADGKEVRYSYNPLRQLEEIHDWLGKTSIAYDALGRTIQVRDHHGREVNHLWGTGNVKEGIIYPDGKKIEYQHDQLLRLTKVIDGEQETKFLYNEYSRLVEKQYPNDLYTKYAYDFRGRILGFSHQTSEKYLESCNFFYDIKGNQLARETNREGLPEESESGGRHGYHYDELDRLQKVHHKGELLRTYQYDGYGNRIQVIEGEKTTNYTYNALNQLLSTVDDDGNSNRYSYDKRGNLIAAYQNDNLTHEYHFGPLNRLEKALNHELQQGAIYQYNGIGHRVEKTEGTPTSPYSHLMLEQMDLIPTKQIEDVIDLTKQYHNLLQRKENQEVTTYVWDSNLLSINRDDGKIQQCLQDELGSLIRVVDEANPQQEVYSYDEFGNSRQLVSDVYQNDKQIFAFTGYQRDKIAGTYYAQAREYQPQVGRFTGVDVVKGNPLHPMTMNEYGYCWNQPLKYVDLNGMEPCPGHCISTLPDDQGGGFLDWLSNTWDTITQGLEPIAEQWVDVQVRDVQNQMDFLDDVISYDRTNTDPQVVMDSRFFSHYNGQFVFRWSPNDRAGSFGGIMLAPRGTDIDTIRHEGGHYVEYQKLGPLRYYSMIGIPSFLSLGRAHVDCYFHQPWEIIAHVLGGANFHIPPPRGAVREGILYHKWVRSLSEAEVLRMAYGMWIWAWYADESGNIPEDILRMLRLYYGIECPN